ncbi:hypothetical protein BC826DRAFT_721893 [Russula brevipes]|nr:hypothetical protein BC826DRAFT_721893 [Russula brevipes]
MTRAINRGRGCQSQDGNVTYSRAVLLAFLGTPLSSWLLEFCPVFQDTPGDRHSAQAHLILRGKSCSSQPHLLSLWPSPREPMQHSVRHTFFKYYMTRGTHLRLPTMCRSSTCALICHILNNCARGGKDRREANREHQGALGSFLRLRLLRQLPALCRPCHPGLPPSTISS